MGERIGEGMSEEYREQYARLQKHEPGLDQFIEIAMRANKFFRSQESEEYIRNFCLKIVKRLGPYSRPL